MSDRIEAEILDVLGEEVAAAVDTPLVVIEGEKGDPGAPGKDGITPTIGANGNWYLGPTDTGKPSRGEKGADGAPGIYYGPTPPTGDTHPVWIDPNGEHDDGGLLPAVTDADNGKVLRVVNSAWSAEDMPTSGTDMGITGSTVGQIAKIAAVDASGVPIAWSPADMPSGGSPDALLYTPQTLTDAQKKQARENIDATASDFVINATVASDNTCTTDKTYAQIQEAIQDGKRAVMKARLSGTDFILPQVGKFLGYYLFAAVLSFDSSVALQYTITVGEQNNEVIGCRIVTYDSDGNLIQSTMDSDPSQPMEIATKQYVDASGVPSVTVADNGKVLRVVNGAWSAEDMPTSGTDMGITGAAVGQIAKITAVDASGVPTAWEPVDMPSGMSEWQLITDTTIAEEDASSTLFVSQKDSGESFLCHELSIAWIGIAVTDGTESGKAWISLNPDKAGYNSGKCGLMTSAYFYYTQQANYMRNMHVKSLPYKVEYVDIDVSTSDTIDAQVIWQNGISSVEVSAYGRKSFYGRVIIYGR